MAKDFLKIGIDGRAIYENTDGIARYSLNLIRSLASIDHTNQYFIFINKKLAGKIIQAPNFNEIPVNFRHLSLLSVFYLPFLLKKYDLDVFHSPFFICPLWQTKNIVLTVHDLMALTFPNFFCGRNYFFEKAAYLYHQVFVPLSIHKAKKIIAVSTSTKNEIINKLHITPEKISVIYEAVDDRFKKNYSFSSIEAFRKQHRLPHNYLLYLGNLKPYKNISLILSAIEILKRKEANKQKLVIAGKKDRFFPFVYNQIKVKDLLDDVIFVDYISDEELPMLFKNASIFLFPSLNEGFGLPPLEAMSLGVPTIVSNTSSLPEVVGDSALLINQGHPQSLAQAISRVLAEVNLKKELSNKGIERSKAFSWEKAAYETLATYNVCGR